MGVGAGSEWHDEGLDEVFTVPGQRAAGGQEWARHLLFGADQPSGGREGEFRDVAVGHAVRAVAAIEAAADAVAGHAGDAGAFAPPIKEAAGSLRGRATAVRVSAEAVLQQAADRPFRVVLMGRTMAGKSTLFEYFSHGDGTRVGDGRQRFSRESCIRMSESLGFEVVDTPGVGAMDGEEDFRAAFSQVVEADLILWVSSDQAAQGQTGRALEQLGTLGKPIVVALNCLADLEDPMARIDLIDDSDRIFGGDALDNLRPIERHLGRAGGRLVGAVLVHAQAALWAAAGRCEAGERDALLTNSRVGDLVDVLRVERKRTGPQRRAISVCDRSRTEMLFAAATASDLYVGLRSTAAASRGSLRDLERHASRFIDDAHAQLSAGWTEALARRERWVENVDVDGDVNALWAAETAGLRSEFDECGRAVDSELRADMDALSADIAEDWASFVPGEFDGLAGYGEAWVNCVAKIGGRVAAGAALGFALGSPVPGPGNVAGAAVGALLGLVSVPVFKLFDKVVDRLFRSKADIRKRRRAQIREQLLPKIAAIRTQVSQSAETFIAGWRSALESELATRARQTEELETAAAQTAAIQQKLEAGLHDLDLATAGELLRVCGYSRVANAAIRATRSQGAGIAIDLPDREFAELVLFPAAASVEPLLPVSPSATFPSAAGLQVLSALTAGTLTVTRMTASRLDAITDEPLPAGVGDAWAALARVHTGGSVSLTTGGDQ